MEINWFVRKETAFKTKHDRFIPHMSILADFKALSIKALQALEACAL